MKTDEPSFDKHKDYWWHENDLINQRITWLLTSHSLLCAGFAWLKYRIAEITFDDKAKSCNADISEVAKIILKN